MTVTRYLRDEVVLDPHRQMFFVFHDQNVFLSAMNVSLARIAFEL